MSQPMEWGPALRNILGGTEDVNTANITSPSWMLLNGSYWTEGQATEPWNQLMPADSNHPGWNMITLYRIRTPPRSRWVYQLIRGHVNFFEGGENSPANESQRLATMSDTVIGGIDNNEFLDAQTFTDASNQFFNVWWWLANNGEPTVTGLVNQINDDSGFDGSAAEAFAWAMQNVFNAMHMLNLNITSPSNWPAQLDENATAITAFKTAFKNAWDTFNNYQYYDPNWLVHEVIKSMETQVDAPGADKTGEYSDAWIFNFTAQGLGEYDLMKPEGWTALNDAMKATWVQNLATLNQASINATGDLIASFDQVWQSMGRGILPFTPLPYPGLTDNPFGEGEGNSEFNPEDLGGSETGEEFGGSEFGGGGGDDSSFGGSEFGGGGGDSSFGGSEFGGGGGDSSFGGGGEFVGGLGGDGLGGNSGVGDAGFGGAGGSFVGGGGLPLPGLGGGLSGTGTDRGTNRGSGFAVGDDDPLGGAGDGGSILPSPLDPADIAGGDFRGGFTSSLNPTHGVTLGPLGTPPPGYAGAGAVTGTPFGASADSDLGSGGYGLENLFGSAARGPLDGSPGGAGAPGLGGLGGMPFMPPMMGSPGGGQNQEKERERTTWLAEEEEVWGTDPDCAPAVVGRDDVEESDRGDRPVRRPTPQRGPRVPSEPGRGRTTRPTS